MVKVSKTEITQEITVKHWKDCQFRQHSGCALNPGGWCYNSKEDLKIKLPPACPFSRGEIWIIKGEV